MKTLVFILVFLVSGFLVKAGEIPTKSVHGKVYDKNTHEVLAGVKVSLEHSDQIVYTDLEGNFTLLVRGQEKATVVFEAMSYTSEKLNVTISLSGVNIELSEL